MNRKWKTVPAAFVIASLSVTALAGCEGIERETGLGDKAQIGAAGGGATGGLIAAAAGGGPAWIAAGVILGGLAGGVIGDQLDKRDQEKLAETSYNAFESETAGGQTSWRNPDTGNSGTTTIDRVYRTSGGQLCKDFTQRVATDAGTDTFRGTACQQPDGTWRVI